MDTLIPGARLARSNLGVAAAVPFLLVALCALVPSRAQAQRVCAGREALPEWAREALREAEQPGDRLIGGYARQLDEMVAKREAIARGAPVPRDRDGAAAPLGFFGTREFPVFLMKFADTQGEPFTDTDLDQQLFSGPTGTMQQYYEEVSYGAFSVDGTVYDWFLLPGVESFYVGTVNGHSAYGLPGYGRTDFAMYAILSAMDPVVPFGQYDNDGDDGFPNSGDDDGVVDFVAFVHPEHGAECATGGNCPAQPDDHLWSHAGWLHRWWPDNAMGADSAFVTNDDWVGHPGEKIVVDRYFVSAGLDCDDQQAGIGTISHEFGHVLGIADLYDFRTLGNPELSEGIGHWGLMGSGPWNTQDSPAHMTAWTKERLGWLFYFNVTAADTYCLPPVETNPIAMRLWQGGALGGQYFVVENRQPLGFDANVHGSGYVIYHVNEGVYDANEGTNTVNVDETFKAIDVECADAYTAEIVVDADDLDIDRCEGGNRGDAGDVWCPATQTTFGPTSVPDTRSTNGAPTDVLVANITTCGGMGEDVCAFFSVGNLGPTMDLCMHDCDGDDCAEITACDTWWASPDLWIDNNGDGEDDLPVEGETNLLWYRVENVGFYVAVGAKLQVFTHEAGFGLRWPEAGTLLAEVDLPTISSGFFQNTIEGSVEIVYPLQPPNGGHYCIGALVTQDLDPQNSQYPPYDNNVVQVNHKVFVERGEGGVPANGAVITTDCGAFTRTSKLLLHYGAEFYGRQVELRLGSPPNFDDASVPAGWNLVYDPGPFILPPASDDSTFVTMSSPAAVHGETAHVPLTMWDIANDKAAGGVVLDYRVDCIDPAPVQNLHATCLGIPGDDDRGPTVLLEWDDVVLDVAGSSEVTQYYEVYRSDDAGHPETLVATVVIDADFGLPGYQWYDDVVVDDIVYTYRVRAIDGTGAVGGLSPPIQLDASDCANWTATDSRPGTDADGIRFLGRPNPFQEGTTLSFRLDAPRHVLLRIYDVSGRLVRTLVDERMSAARHDVSWDGRAEDGSRSPGIYFARLRAEGSPATRKLVLLE